MSGPAGPSTDAAFGSYLEAMENAPLLGHLVLYSIYDGPVTRDDLVRWFTELGLDDALLPPEIRPVDAFEKVTGNVKVSYPIEPADARSSKRGERPRAATLMVRHVRRDPDQIVRHLVREVRDEQQTRLSYDVKVGECVFRRDPTPRAPTAGHGAGSLHVAPDFASVPSPIEQEHIHAVLAHIKDAYRRHCAYLTGDRLRGVIRAHVENLNAIKVRPTGGVYFVHHRYHPTLNALRELVKRFGAGSHLVRLPIPAHDEMREMVIAAWRTKAKTDLDRLAQDIAAAQSSGNPGTIAQALYKRFRDLQAAAAEHSQLLSTGLDDTTAALQLVQAQLATLLSTAG